MKKIFKRRWSFPRSGFGERLSPRGEVGRWKIPGYVGNHSTQKAFEEVVDEI